MTTIVAHGWSRYNFANDWIIDANTLHIRSVRLPLWIIAPLAILLVIGIPTVFWVATYLRIKEKQV